MTFLLLIVPVIVWIAFAKYWMKHTFSVKEMIAQSILSVVVIGGLLLTSDMIQMGSTKLVNGEVTETRPVRKACPYGWVTFTDSHCTNYITRVVKIGETCSTDSKGNRSCTNIYQTEYAYIYPWERRYFVDTDLNHVFEINRTDAQGAITPPRFAEIHVGDPVTLPVYYRNYIRAAADTLFKTEKLEKLSLTYPKVFDYYRVNRVIYDDVSSTTPELMAWNRRVSELNRDIRSTGANVIIVVTSKPESYAEQLAFTWDGYNINDLVVVIGVGDDGRSIAWTDVRSWSQQSLVNIRLKDAINELGTLDPEKINAQIRDIVSADYRLQDIEAFSYLKHDISLPTTTIVLALLMIFVFTPLITLWFARRVDWR